MTNDQDTQAERLVLADYIEHEQACGVDIKLGDGEAEKIVAILRTLPRNAAPAGQIYVKPMHLSDGRTDYFVAIKVGDREVTPHVFREEFKAAYHAALYDWLLNGTEKPKLIEFGPDDWPAFVSAAAGQADGVREGFTPADAWRELIEKDDRTSPEEYPDHALITAQELANFMNRASPSAPPADVRAALEKIINIDRLERRTTVKCDPAGNTIAIEEIDGPCAAIARAALASLPASGTAGGDVAVTRPERGGESA